MAMEETENAQCRTLNLSCLLQADRHSMGEQFKLLNLDKRRFFSAHGLKASFPSSLHEHLLLKKTRRLVPVDKLAKKINDHLEEL